MKRIVIGTIVASLLPFVVVALVHPTPLDWRRLKFDPPVKHYALLSGREDEPEVGWTQGDKPGQVEMEYLAQYERLRTQAGPAPYGQGYRQGRSIADAQRLANATGRPVDVLIP